MSQTDRKYPTTPTSDPTAPLVLVEGRGEVLEVTINRPAKMNALNQLTIDALAAAWHQFEQGPWKVAVLSGAGPRAFCAGADFDDPPVDDDPAYPNIGTPLTKPIITAVDGYAVGAGFVLSQASDIVVAGKGSTFGYPEARIGVTGGGATFITTRVPTKVVADLLLTGRFYSTERAVAAGLVSEVVEQGQAVERARELADQVAANSQECVLALKALIDRDTQRSTIEGTLLSGRVTRNTKDRAVLGEKRGLKGVAGN